MNDKNTSSIIVLVAIVSFFGWIVFSFGFMFLWNACVVGILPVQVINIWQSFGILVLLNFVGSLFSK